MSIDVILAKHIRNYNARSMTVMMSCCVYVVRT
jgi:hypothetical protein